MQFWKGIDTQGLPQGILPRAANGAVHRSSGTGSIWISFERELSGVWKICLGTLKTVSARSSARWNMTMATTRVPSSVRDRGLMFLTCVSIAYLPGGRPSEPYYSRHTVVTGWGKGRVRLFNDHRLIQFGSQLAKGTPPYTGFPKTTS